MMICFTEVEEELFEKGFSLLTFLKTFIHYLLLLLITVGVIPACASAMSNAQSAIESAQREGERLVSTNAPESVTLPYRIHISKAREALQKKKYGEAQREAKLAEENAREAYLKREQLALDVKARANQIRLFLETQCRPPQAFVESYFDILDALERLDYERASELVIQLETQILSLERFAPERDVIIQAEIWYYSEKFIIPVYASVSEDGEPGIVIRELKKPVRGVFLGAKYFSRELIYYKVFLEDGDKKVEGWVDRRFVE